MSKVNKLDISIPQLSIEPQFHLDHINGAIISVIIAKAFSNSSSD